MQRPINVLVNGEPATLTVVAVDHQHDRATVQLRLDARHSIVAHCFPDTVPAFGQRPVTLAAHSLLIAPA